MEASEQGRSDLISFDGLEQPIPLLSNVIQERGPFDATELLTGHDHSYIGVHAMRLTRKNCQQL